MLTGLNPDATQDTKNDVLNVVQVLSRDVGKWRHGSILCNTANVVFFISKGIRLLFYGEKIYNTKQSKTIPQEAYRLWHNLSKHNVPGRVPHTRLRGYPSPDLALMVPHSWPEGGTPSWPGSGNPIMGYPWPEMGYPPESILGPVTGVHPKKDMGPVEVLWDKNGVSPHPGVNRLKTLPSVLLRTRALINIAVFFDRFKL